MNDSSKKKIALNASRDFIFSVLALLVYNGVLQLVIYPGLNTGMGAEAFGTVLYLISVVSIMGAGFGTAASYSRMVAKKDRTQSNGDYNVFLLIIALISTAVTFAALFVLKELSFIPYLGVLVLMIVTVFRYYADVEYRMNIRFRDYFLFFMSTSVGYVLGLFLFRYTNSWVIVLLTGELFGLIYTVIRGKIFRAPFFDLSDSFKKNLSSAFIISASNLISALILNSDRIVLRLLVGAREVTVFYTASLIGKIVAMLTTPLNGIIISYFTNYKIKMTRKLFLLMSAGLLLISAIGAFACTGVSYIFVKLMYAEVFEEARSYFFLANLGQILYFLSGTLMVIVMSFTKEKLQLVINVIYVIAFAAVVIPGTVLFGLTGMAYGLVMVNAIRFLVSVFLGLRACPK
jgi:O-antigen/teichoic acid export membrane protein